MKYKIFSMFDYLLLGIVLLLITVGILFIYSSSVNSDGISVTNEYIKQIIWASAGLIVMIFFTIYDYRRTESYSLWLFLAFIVILILTRLFGKEVKGAKSWIGIGDIGGQPSEFAKVIFILFLARYLDISRDEVPMKRFLISTGIMLVPMGLILIQPDMGTASVFIAIFLVMCYFAGIPKKYIFYVLSFGLLTILLSCIPFWNNLIAKTPHPAVSILTNNKLRAILIASTLTITLLGIILRRYFHAPKYVLWISYVFSIITFALIFSVLFSKVLKDYQVKRLIIFINPDVDPLNAGWNINQSKIAIGSGGFSGRGYLNGTQSHYRFLPEQSTDFIFSILSEEFGFIGGILVFASYMFIFIKILFIIRKCPNRYGTYIAAGIFGMFIFHFFINVGMVMGIMPITGIPLLFMSYGGSSLMTSMICVGLLMSIRARRKELV